MSEAIESKQDKVVAMVQAGIYTRKEILEAVGCTVGALASYLSGMRNAARYSGTKLYPIEVVNADDVKCFTVTTYAEADAMASAASPKKASSAKPWAVRMELAEKRVAKAQRAVDVTTARADKTAAMIDSLYLKAAEVELELAKYLLTDLANSEVAGDSEVEPEVATEDDLI